MFMKPTHVVCALAMVVVGSGSVAWAQDGGKTKDDALESLLKELAEPEKGKADSSKAPRPKGQKEGGTTPQKDGPGSSAVQAKKASADTAKKPQTPRKPEAPKLAPKDEALDELLGKLGESKDEPTPEEHPKGGGPGADREPKPSAGGGKPDADKLGGNDKDLDERLEELTGRKKKRQSSDQERTGPIGDMIKEMRDVEERLGKPDPSEGTQKKQKEIVKRIETLIEQARQSGSSMGRMTMRRVRQAGQKEGQQNGQQPGAMAQGAPPMKPAKPTTQHSTADGKETWGHLPDELRQVMENSFKEVELDSKRELISRYFLSVGKGKTVRGE